MTVNWSRHCERSAAIQAIGLHGLPRCCATRSDGFVILWRPASARWLFEFIRGTLAANESGIVLALLFARLAAYVAIEHFVQINRHNTVICK